MQLTDFQVTGLFDRFDHSIPIKPDSPKQVPMSLNQAPAPSVVILHGVNGVGKTTVLRMLDGILRLDFNVFRAVPFSTCTLSFNTGDQITVRPSGSAEEGRPDPIIVKFRDHTMTLDPLETGPLLDEDRHAVRAFREEFSTATEEIHFQLLDAQRFLRRNVSDDFSNLIRLRYKLSEESDRSSLRAARTALERSLRTFQDRPSERERDIRLAGQVKQFIARAQADYQRFFTLREPDLFARIIGRLDQTQTSEVDPGSLKDRLVQIQEWDSANQRLGLRSDRWDFEQLNEILLSSDTSQEALNVLAAYVEVLESRVAERNVIADRLSKFEQLMAQFYEGIAVTIHRKDGFQIVTDNGERLHEEQLSSGEYHLLYLMVTALTTRRRGTVIAIDEPELSMHIGWQRKLVRGLVECAAGAEPQFILATHSPDLVAEFRTSMIRLGPEPEGD